MGYRAANTAGEGGLLRTDRPNDGPVGYAMAACPENKDVPCHRVVDRLGGTKKAFDDYMPDGQRFLLEAEDVIFRQDGTVDMDRCQWRPEQERT